MNTEYIYIEPEDPLMQDLRKESIRSLKLFVKDIEDSSSYGMREILDDLYKMADGLMYRFEKIEERLDNQFPWGYHE